MSDRLISADKVAEAIDWLNEYDFVLWNEIMKCIDKVPEVDAVPVVRCDDCIYRDGKTPGQPNILCWQMHFDDFCSYGTKREVGTYCEDIVSVVRCKDCKYYNEHPSGFGCCEIHKGSIAIQTPFTFCAWGERKEDDGNLISNRKCSECLHTQNITGLRKYCHDCEVKMSEENN